MPYGRRGKYHEHALTELVGLILVANNGLPMTAREIWVELGRRYYIDITEHHVWTTLSKLLRDQRILRTSRGHYRCTPRDLEIHNDTRPRGKSHHPQNNTTAK